MPYSLSGETIRMKQNSFLLPRKVSILILLIGLALVTSGSAAGFLSDGTYADLAFPINETHSQDDEFAWVGEWQLSTYWEIIPFEKMTISQAANGSYSIEFFPPMEDDDDDWHPQPEQIEKVSVTDYGFTYNSEEVYDGLVFSRVEIYFERTENPGQLRGYIDVVSEHQFSGNESGWNIVNNNFDFGTHDLCAARTGWAFPSPCGAVGITSAPEEAATPNDQEPPADTDRGGELPEQDTSDTSLDWEQEANDENSDVGQGPSFDDAFQNDKVSPSGQAAAAVGTTTLIALWLFYDHFTRWGDPWIKPSQPSTRHTANIPNNLSESGGRGSENTLPVDESPGTPPLSVGENKNPAYPGPVNEIEREIFDGKDAHTILQALEIIPNDVSDTGEMQISRAELENFLSRHPDGKPHQITLPNGNTVIIDRVQGIAFDDGLPGDPDRSKIDFNQRIAITVDVVQTENVGVPTSSLPGISLPENGIDGSQKGQKVDVKMDKPPDQMVRDPKDEKPPELVKDEKVDAQKDEPPEPVEAKQDGQQFEVAQDDQQAEQKQDDQLAEVQKDDPQADLMDQKSKEDEAELDRFFGDSAGGDDLGSDAGSLQRGSGEQPVTTGTGEGVPTEPTDASGMSGQDVVDHRTETSYRSRYYSMTDEEHHSMTNEEICRAITSELQDPSTPPEAKELLRLELELYENMPDIEAAPDPGQIESPNPPGDSGNDAEILDDGGSSAATEDF